MPNQDARKRAIRDKEIRNAKAGMPDKPAFYKSGTVTQNMIRRESVKRVSSRSKGKRGEREVVAHLQPVLDRVYAQLRADHPQLAVGEAPRIQRNTLQSDKGGYDLVGVDWMAAEVKNQERLQLGEWWKQCFAQAKKGETPVLFYKRNGTGWRVRMRAKVTVVSYLPVWEPLVDVAIEEWLAYFSMRSYEEAGAAAAYQRSRMQGGDG